MEPGILEHTFDQVKKKSWKLTKKWKKEPIFSDINRFFCNEKTETDESFNKDPEKLDMTRTAKPPQSTMEAAKKGLFLMAVQ